MLSGSSLFNLILGFSWWEELVILRGSDLYGVRFISQLIERYIDGLHSSEVVWCYRVNYDFFTYPGDGPWLLGNVYRWLNWQFRRRRLGIPALILVLGALGGIIDFGITYHFAWLAPLGLIGSNFFGSRTNPKHSCLVTPAANGLVVSRDSKDFNLGYWPFFFFNK